MLRANAGAEMNRTQILTEFEVRFFAMLPSRFPNWFMEDQRRDQFSRALAAFAIQKLSGCSDIEAAVTWCQRATTHSLDYGGKPWRYTLIPHDAIAENMTLDGLVAQYLSTGMDRHNSGNGKDA